MKHRKLENSELDRPDLQEVQSMERYPIHVVLDNIRSLNNIGSVFRTGDAFLAEKSFLPVRVFTVSNKSVYKYLFN